VRKAIPRGRAVDLTHGRRSADGRCVSSRMANQSRPVKIVPARFRSRSNRRVQRTTSGSTPHDRVTLLQISSSCSPALAQPRQSTPSSLPTVANRRATHAVRRYPSLIRQPLHRRTTRCIGSVQTSQITRGTQIPIVPPARLPISGDRRPMSAAGRLSTM
jgi:hypothetical protein